MKTIAFTILILMCSITARSQDLNDFTHSLMSPDSVLDSRVSIIEHDNLSSTLSEIYKTIHIDEIDGFRVRLFVDNSQTARSDAKQIQKRFKKRFPNICTYLSYENPYFKVAVGNFSTLEEATMLWGQVNKVFNRAFVVREKFDIKLLHDTPAIEKSADDKSLVDPVQNNVSPT